MYLVTQDVSQIMLIVFSERLYEVSVSELCLFTSHVF